MTGGEVVESLVTGEPVIVAARLEQMAAHGEILVGPITREITRGRVRYGPARTIETKGMGPIEVAAALSLAGPGAATGHTATPLVGRETRCGPLDDVHCRHSTGRPHLVTIYGDAAGQDARARVPGRLILPSRPRVPPACVRTSITTVAAEPSARGCNHAD